MQDKITALTYRKCPPSYVKFGTHTTDWTERSAESLEVIG